MALKVFDLACDQGHVFEAWFSSHADYEQQQNQGLLSCPLCNSTHIKKRLSAPRLNLGATDATTPAVSTLQAQVLQQLRSLIKNSDDVGDQFANEAQKMQRGEAPERAIRGSATYEEYQSLREEGIEVVAIPDFLDHDKLN